MKKSDTKKEMTTLQIGFRMAAIAVSCTIFLFTTSEYRADLKAEQEKAAEVLNEESKPLELPVVEFNDKDLKNKAVLFVQKEKNIGEAERTLVELANTYNLPIEKVYFGEDIENFVKDQEDKINTHYPIVAELGSKLLTEEKDGQISFNEKANQSILLALSKLESGDNADIEVKGLAEQTNLTAEEVLSYLENRMKLSEVKIERPIQKEEGAVLVLFNSNQEFGRVNALDQEVASLQWLLISKGLLNLSQTESGQQAIEALNKEGELIVSFGTSTCPFCANTTPVIQGLAKDANVEFIQVDIEASVNGEALNTLTADYLSAPVENTPTVAYFKDGKEVSRFVGQQDYLTMEKFIRDNQQALAEKEKSSKESSE